MTTTTVLPDTITYSIWIGEAANSQEAKVFFDQMKAAGLKPDEIAYSTLINKSNNLTEAKVFLAETKTIGLKPNGITYTTLIRKSSTFQQAILFFNQMKDSQRSIKVRAYNTLLEKCEQWDQLEPLLEEMIAQKIRPQFQGQSYNKRHRRNKNYTLRAILPTVRKYQVAYREWRLTQWMDPI